jgi:hypothetical protein
MSWLDRDLLAARVVNLSDPTQITGILPAASGGTGLGAVGSNGQVLTVVSGAPAWATPGSGSYEVLATVVDSDHTLTEFVQGVIVVPYSGLTAPRALNLPDAIEVGTVVIAGTIDNSLTDAHTIVWTPASGTIEYANVSAATFTQTQDNFPLNSTVKFIKKTSTLWISI